MSSISSTLRPMRNGLRYFSIAVSTTSARCVNVAHPQPTSPGSVVSTLTTTRRMPLGAVRIVRMSRILTGAVAFGAGGGAAAACVVMAENASRLASSDAPPVSESARSARRRSIVMPPPARGRAGVRLRLARVCLQSPHPAESVVAEQPAQDGLGQRQAADLAAVDLE